MTVRPRLGTAQRGGDLQRAPDRPRVLARGACSRRGYRQRSAHGLAAHACCRKLDPTANRWAGGARPGRGATPHPPHTPFTSAPPDSVHQPVTATGLDWSWSRLVSRATRYELLILNTTGRHTVSARCGHALKPKLKHRLIRRLKRRGRQVRLGDRPAWVRSARPDQLDRRRHLVQPPTRDPRLWVLVQGLDRSVSCDISP
jgi:hypothetical protein